MLKVDAETVAHDVGRIVQAVSLMMVISILVAALNSEFYAVPAFVVSAIIMAGIGTGRLATVLPAFTVGYVLVMSVLGSVLIQQADTVTDALAPSAR